MEEIVLETRGLAKSYGPVRALRGVETADLITELQVPLSPRG